VFNIYNKLYNHIDKSIHQLQRKNVPWKKVILTALYAAKGKLSHYYSMTDNIHGDLYAVGTIIAPQYKLHFFSTKDCQQRIGAGDIVRVLRIVWSHINSDF